MLSGIHVFCFFATCAFIVLGLEVSRLFFRMPVRLVVMLGIAAVGFIAQTLYLWQRLPLVTWHDWFLGSAWVLVAAYLGMAVSRPTTMVGVFLLPIVIALILVAGVVPRDASFPREQLWGFAHGMMLLLGTVTVSFGFVAGLMYLVQSWRLKHHVSPQAGLKLPSLEWLQAVNKQSLIFSSLFIALGLIAGIILNTIKARQNVGALPWTDSVVVSSAVLLVWLLLATAFEWLYKPAQQGRKVAYLTVASFLFLALVVMLLVAGGSKHGREGGGRRGFRVRGSGFRQSRIRCGRLDWRSILGTEYSVLSTQYSVRLKPSTDEPTSRPPATDRHCPAPRLGGRTMKLHMVGCSHHNAAVAVRERLAFSRDQAAEALTRFRSRYPEAEAVLLSTCNRVELYFASETAEACPSHNDAVNFLAEFHGLSPTDLFNELFEHTGEDFVRHLFTVAASLDSMVVGEAQILSQVKQAYELANSVAATGTITNSAFQAALRVAKRVATETAIQQKRVSIPSVAVAEFAKSIFERFDDKHVLVIGAGEMGEEALRYLIDEGVAQISIVNRNLARAEDLATRLAGQPRPWSDLHALLVEADLVVSATGATEPILTAADFRPIVAERFQRTLLILDLAIPRDFDPAINDLTGVFLYSIDDLKAVCERNRLDREKEWPKAQKLIEEETARFMADLHHRATAPTIRRLKARADEVKADELARLLNKLGNVDQKTRQEIGTAFDRLVNKLLHPPLESLRDEAEQGTPHGLLDALKRLFKLKD